MRKLMRAMMVQRKRRRRRRRQRYGSWEHLLGWLAYFICVDFLEDLHWGTVLVFWFGLDVLVFRTAQLSNLFSFGILNSIMIFRGDGSKSDMAEKKLPPF